MSPDKQHRSFCNTYKTFVSLEREAVYGRALADACFCTVKPKRHSSGKLKLIISLLSMLEELIDAKKLELETHKADKETMQKFQKNIDQIQQQIKKGRSRKE